MSRTMVATVRTMMLISRMKVIVIMGIMVMVMMVMMMMLIDVSQVVHYFQITGIPQHSVATIQMSGQTSTHYTCICSGISSQNLGQ